MGKVAVQDNAGSLFYFQRNHVIHAKGGSVKNLHFRSSAFLSAEPLAQRSLMSTWFSPEASVFYGGIFQSEPKTNTGGGFGVKEGGILVVVDHATNTGVFEDKHALDEHRILHF